VAVDTRGAAACSSTRTGVVSDRDHQRHHHLDDRISRPGRRPPARSGPPNRSGAVRPHLPGHNRTTSARSAPSPSTSTPNLPGSTRPDGQRFRAPGIALQPVHHISAPTSAPSSCRGRRHHADEPPGASCASKVTASSAISVRGNTRMETRYSADLRPTTTSGPTRNGPHPSPGRSHPGAGGPAGAPQGHLSGGPLRHSPTKPCAARPQSPAGPDRANQRRDGRPAMVRVL
jgi:hypothetical protein